MSHKYCTKKGHHEGRLIEAICLRPQCVDDRLLCFYCKHQNHRFHETAYFPKGLSASLQTFNQNSCMENSQKQRKKIERKISSIKKGWQGVSKTMNQNLKLIQDSINQSYETIESTFSINSVLQIKQKLSTQEIPTTEVEKYVRMINRVNEFELNNHEKVMVYSKLKRRVMEDVFNRAAYEVSGVVEQFSEKTKLLNFNSDELESYIQAYFDEENNIQRNRQNLMLESLFSNEDSNNDFQKRFDSEFDETESQFSSVDGEKSVSQNQDQFHDEIVESQNVEPSISAGKELQSSNINPSVTSSPNYSEKKFKIRIENRFTESEVQENTQEVIHQEIEEKQAKNQASYQNDQSSPQQSTERLQYRNIIKLKNQGIQNDRFQFQGFDPNTILCCRKMSLPYEDEEEEDEEQSIIDLSKSKKKIKPDSEVETEPAGQRSGLQKRIHGLFEDIIKDDSSSNDQSESFEVRKKSEKITKPKSDKIYGSFDFSQVKHTKVGRPKKQAGVTKNSQTEKEPLVQLEQFTDKAPSKQQTFVQERYIQIHRSVIKLPQNSNPKQNQNHFLYPNVKIYGHSLEEIYQSLQMLDPEVVTKLQIYCDTTTLCLDHECVELIIKMKKLTSLMVYMTYQMNRTDFKKIVKNLPLLEELVLSEFNKMDGELAKLIRDRLPKLRRFFYTVDERNYMQKMEENLQFFIDFNIQSTSLEVIEVLSEIPNLQTIQIINVSNKVATKIPNFLKRMRHLKEVCITNTNNPQSNSTEIVEFLANSHLKLEVFCAHNTTFRQSSLVKIIEKNKNLHTLIINECLQLRNETMTVLAKNCPNLKQLSLMLIDSINGREICTFTGLKTLVLRGCWQIDQDFFFKNIHKLSELEFLSVSLNNYWFYDHLMKEVVKLSKLKFLNLDTTKVSDAGIKDLHKLQQLETLICGKTEVSFKQLIKALKGPSRASKNWTIRKLGLSKDESYSKQVESKTSKNKHDLSITEFKAKNLIALGKALPGLTHLSIGGFVNPKKEYFETLKNLKCLFVTKKQLASETENWLVNKGVYINEDY